VRAEKSLERQCRGPLLGTVVYHARAGDHHTFDEIALLVARALTQGVQANTAPPRSDDNVIGDKHDANVICKARRAGEFPF